MESLVLVLSLVVLFMALLVLSTLALGERLWGDDRQPDAIEKIPRADGGWLHADRFLVNDAPRKGVVVTCHGIGTSRRHMDFDEEHSLARTIHQAGYEVWNIDLRGVGESRRLNPKDRSWTVDDHVAIDVPAVLAAVTERAGTDKVHWVGHSMGGLVAYGWLASHPDDGRMASLITLGSPVKHAPGRWEHLGARPSVWLAAKVPSIPGHWPARALALLVLPIRVPFQPITPSSFTTSELRRMAWRVPEPMSGRAASQLSRMWSGQGFQSADGEVCYLDQLAKVEVPVRIVASVGDHMAPPHTVSPAAELWGGPVCEYIVLGTDEGEVNAPCHAGMLAGRAAPRQVYPLVLDWLDRQA